MNKVKEYYNTIYKSYNKLYKDEQLKKWNIIKNIYNFSNKYVLDLGCGTGIITFEISKIAKKVVGIDISENMLKLVPKKENLKVILYDGKKLPFKNKEFDIVISTTVLQDIKRPKKIIEEIKRVGKKHIISILKKGKWNKSKVNKYFPNDKIIEEEKDWIIFT